MMIDQRPNTAVVVAMLLSYFAQADKLCADSVTKEKKKGGGVKKR